MYKKLFKKIKADAPGWANEEEVRISWVSHLRAELDVSVKAERGRNDAHSNNVIIEFKDKGHFHGSETSAAFKEAIFNRLDKYIIRRAAEEGLPEEDYIGIAIDGEHVCFAFRKGGKIKHRSLIPFSEKAVDLVAQALVDAERRAVTSDNLIEDFGHGSTVGDGMMQALARELETHLLDPKNNKIKMLFKEWRTLFGQVADLSAAQVVEIRRAVPLRAAALEDDEVPALLFVIHTYNAFIIKILAAEIVSEFGLTAHPDFCESLLKLPDDFQLFQRLDSELERSGFFQAAQIRGFVEEAIFGWYGDASLSAEGRKKIAESIRSLLVQVALYRMDALDEARSKDVLKAFYQALVPESLRKALGEFYTPDWLADFACQRASTGDWLLLRALDPTCGSGTFLLQFIRRKRERAAAEGWSAEDTLDHLTTSVWGFDLNPLAVQSARVNFLIAVADLLHTAKGHPVELPVLLADAVYSPAQAPGTGMTVVEYEIGSTHADLKITLPAKLAFDRKRLDDVFEVMGERVEANDEYTAAEDKLKGILTSAELKKWAGPLKTTYDRVLSLHRQNWNGIWFRIVRNFFWSATAGRFDVVVGNPPWVRWSNLPEAYRTRIKPTCQQYEIFSDSPYHGGNELDISGMITYTVGDKWLRDGGALVFLITQTHFQSPSSQGFRSFKVDGSTYLAPVMVDDLKLLKPFPNVANKTALMKLHKGAAAPVYPVPYRVWTKAEGYTATIPAEASWPAVAGRVAVAEMEASPVDGKQGPWAVLRKGRLHQMRTICGVSDWVQGRKGITTDLNGLFMVRVLDHNPKTGLVRVQTRPEACKGPNRRKIEPASTFWVEPDCLFPLVKGAADFSACHFEPADPDVFVLVPNDGIRRRDYEAATALVDGLKNLRKYFNTYAAALSQRSTYKLRQHGSDAPPYAVYNVGAYTFAPYKVMWPEQGRFEVAVAETAAVPLKSAPQPYVPDHKVYFAEAWDRKTAYFLCGMLNCSLVREYVESHTIGIQRSNVFKHLRLPSFDRKNAMHARLSSLALAAHHAPAEKRERILDQMDRLALRLLV